jgi:hypothetical protein
LERTGYTLDVTTGQRKYGGPPPGWDGPTPGNGCEVRWCNMEAGGDYHSRQLQWKENNIYKHKLFTYIYTHTDA